MSDTSSSKQLVRTTLSGRPALRPPFLPWVSSFAAKIEQVSVRDMLTDAALLTRALQSAQKLFGYDAIVVGFDSTVEAEACGCAVDWTGGEGLPVVAGHPLAEGMAVDEIDEAAIGIGDRGRFPVLLETTRRLTPTAGRNVAIVAHVTGPLTLATNLLGSDVVGALDSGLEETSAAAGRALDLAGRVMAKVCRLYGELKVDAVVIGERLLARTPATLTSSRIKRSMQQALNVAKFYNLSSIVLPGGPLDSSQTEAICALGATAVVLGQGDAAEDALAKNRRLVLGRSIPLAVLRDSRDLAQQVSLLRAPLANRAYFITTEWEIPYETPVDNLHEAARLCREFAVA